LYGRSSRKRFSARHANPGGAPLNWKRGAVWLLGSLLGAIIAPMNYLAPMFLFGLNTIDSRLALAAPLAWIAMIGQLVTPSSAGEWSLVGVPFVSTAIALPWLMRRLDVERRARKRSFRKASARLGILFGFVASMVTGLLIGVLAASLGPGPESPWLRALSGLTTGVLLGIFGMTWFVLSILVSGSLYGLLIGKLLEIADHGRTPEAAAVAPRPL
jgi:hypothetical protein